MEENNKITMIKTSPNPPLTEKLLQVAENFIKEKERRYFGVAGAGLENQLKDPKYKEFNANRKLVSLGISGEKETSKILRKWIVDKPDVVLFDSLHFPLGDKEEVPISEDEEEVEEVDSETGEINVLGDIDHLLIIRDRIVLIDSKNWKKKSTYSLNGKGGVLRGGKPFRGGYPHVRQAEYVAKKFYSEFPVDIHSFVCISNNECSIVRNRDWWANHYKLVNHETLTKFLDELYEEIKETDGGEGFINLNLVGLTLTGVQRPYNAVKEQYPHIYKMMNRG